MQRDQRINRDPRRANPRINRKKSDSEHVVPSHNMKKDFKGKGSYIDKIQRPKKVAQIYRPIEKPNPGNDHKIGDVGQKEGPVKIGGASEF